MKNSSSGNLISNVKNKSLDKRAPKERKFIERQLGLTDLKKNNIPKQSSRNAEKPNSAKSSLNEEVPLKISTIKSKPSNQVENSSVKPAPNSEKDDKSTIDKSKKSKI